MHSTDTPFASSVERSSTPAMEERPLSQIVMTLSADPGVINVPSTVGTPSTPQSLPSSLLRASSLTVFPSPGGSCKDSTAVTSQKCPRFRRNVTDRGGSTKKPVRNKKVKDGKVSRSIKLSVTAVHKRRPSLQMSKSAPKREIDRAAKASAEKYDDLNASDLEDRIRAFSKYDKPLFITGFAAPSTALRPSVANIPTGVTTSADTGGGTASCRDTSIPTVMPRTIDTRTSVSSIPSIFDLPVSLPVRHRLPPPPTRYDKSSAAFYQPAMFPFQFGNPTASTLLSTCWDYQPLSGMMYHPQAVP